MVSPSPLRALLLTSVLLAIFAGSGHALTTRRVTINGNETAIETTYTIAALSDRGTRVKGKRQEILCDFSPPPNSQLHFVYLLLLHTRLTCLFFPCTVCVACTACLCNRGRVLVF